MARYDLTAPYVYSEPAKLLEKFLDDATEHIAPSLFESLSDLCQEIDKIGLNSETEINELHQEKEELEKQVEQLENRLEELEIDN